MEKIKEKKAKLSKEEKRSERALRRACFKAELKEGAGFLKDRANSVLIWFMIYSGMALISLFFTKWTVSDTGDFPEILYDTVPRAFSLLLLTVGAFSTKFRKTFFTVGATVWTVWLLLLSNVSYGFAVAAGIIGAMLSFVFGYIECIKGRASKPSAVMTRAAAWFYAFAVLALVIEIVHRIDVSKTFLNIYAPFVTLIKNPDIFANNMIVIMMTGLFVFICKKKKLAFSIFSSVWVLLAFVSYLKYNNVYEPALLLDVFQIVDGIAAVKKYFSIISVLLFFAVLALLVLLIVFSAKREKSVHVNACTYVFVLCSFAVALATFCGVRTLSYTDAASKYVRTNYFSMGFPFSFVNYAANSHVSVPEGYSKYKIDEIENIVKSEYKASGSEKEVQNIIVVQMESFCDPYLFAKKYKELELERDPMPFLRSLMSEYSTGNVNVPVFGGQTVKSEFEFLTGMGMNNLPSGYNPYVTYLYNHHVDSFVSYVKENGYTATAIHDYQGEFFSRNQVYEQLGFDTFVPYECMSGVEKRIGSIWANDEILISEIERALDSTEGKDFVFSVSVQLHGSYKPIDKSEYTMGIYNVADEEFEGKIAYYISQLEQFDKTIENLIKMLNERNEPTYVLLYSDHLPSLFYDFNEMSDIDKFTTQYFSWNNLGIEKHDENIELYRLSTKLCSELGISGSFINRFHSVFSGKTADEYEQARDIVDYNIMFEDEENTAFENAAYKVGLYPLSISAIEPVAAEDGHKYRYIIHGSEITENTVIAVNGHVYDIEFEDRNTAYFNTNNRLNENDLILLRIIGERNGTVLCESREFSYRDKTLIGAQNKSGDGYEDDMRLELAADA